MKINWTKIVINYLTLMCLATLSVLGRMFHTMELSKLLALTMSIGVSVAVVRILIEEEI